MADTFQLQVATAERQMVDEPVTEAQLPGKNGYLGILAGHAPLLSALGAGTLSYQGGSGSHALVIAGGFVEISDNTVRVLADNAQVPSEINVDQARRDLETAAQELHGAQTEQESDRALESMQRAQAKLDAPR